jgi:WD40 repeat protein
MLQDQRGAGVISIPPTLDPRKAWESQKFEHDRPLLCCACSPCGQFVLAGAQDEHLIRWKLDGGEKKLATGHESWVHAVTFHPDRKRVLAGDLHGVIRCWDYTSDMASPLWTTLSNHPWVQAASVTPDGKRWITVGTDGPIRFWNVDDGKPAGELVGHESEVYCLAVHPDGKHLLTGDLLGKIHVWNLESMTLIRSLDARLLHTRKEDFLADVGGVRAIAISGDGTRVAAGGMTDAESNTFCPGKPAVLIFDFASGQLKSTLRPKEKSDGPIKALAFLANDVLAAHAEHLNGASSLEFFAPNANDSQHAIKRESAYSMSLHPDGLRIAVASFSPHGRGGNGRHAKPEEYVPHKGQLVVYRLEEKK